MSEKKNTGKKAVIAVIVIAQQSQVPRPAARRCEADSLT